MRYTVTTKVNEEEYEQIKAKAELKGMSVSGYLKKSVLDDLEYGAIKEMGQVYGLSSDALIRNIRFLLDSGKLFVKNGKFVWQPLRMNPEYLSLDDKIDLMNISDSEKAQLKQKIADNLDSLIKQDDLGNGAGL